MDRVLATVNINIGLGKDNPSLIIRECDSIPDLVNRLINQYNLPRRVYDIIIGKVNEQLHRPSIQQKKSQDRHSKSIKTNPKKSVSPIKTNQISKQNTQRPVPIKKQNNRNGTNSYQIPHSLIQKSPSPLSKSDVTIKKKKIELNPGKNSIKRQRKSLSKQGRESKDQLDHNIQQFFRHLTRENPSHVKILIPKYINLKGIDRGLLCQLQQFFLCIQQGEFDLMTESYFVNKVGQMNFKKRLGRKEYEYCYLG